MIKGGNDMCKKFKIAFFTPIKEGSKSYYFSSCVLPELKKICDIDIFSDDKEAKEAFNLPHFHYLSAFLHDKEKHYDLFFYQVENREELAFSRVHLALKQGVVLFHDICFSYDPPQAIIQTTHPNNYYLARREFGKSLFSIMTNLDDIKVASCYTRNNIKSSYENNITFMNYPAKVNENFVKEKNKITQIVFKGDQSISTRSHKMLEALKGIENFHLTWLTNKSNFETVGTLCRHNNIQSFSILEDSISNEDDALSKSDIAISLCQNYLSDRSYHVWHHSVLFIFKALLNNVFVISNNNEDLDIFPASYIAKVDAGENEAFKIKFFIEAFKDRKINLDYKRLKEEFFQELSPKIISNELLFLFENLKDEIKNFYILRENEEYLAKKKMLKKAFNEDDEYLLESRKELGFV